MSFKPKQRVVCIDGKFDRSQPNFNAIFHELPVENKVYTIRECESGAVKLGEVNNPEMPIEVAGVIMWEEPGFAERRFRDLEELMKEEAGILEEEAVKVDPIADPLKEREVVEI